MLVKENRKNNEKDHLQDLQQCQDTWSNSWAQLA